MLTFLCLRELRFKNLYNGVLIRELNVKILFQYYSAEVVEGLLLGDDNFSALDQFCLNNV